ncbi:MAG: extracellular solute-binding protein [Clostridia bacterium]|nr:extracellular solute-binding protein [Clostridia bacterium]
MKSYFKKTLCLLVALLMLVFAFSACGDSSGDTDAASSTPNGNANNSSEIIVEPNKPEIQEGSKYDPATWNPYATISESIKGQTVRQATWGDPTTNESAIVYANFEADTGLKCEVFTVPQAGYPQHIKTKIAIGDAPDVFMTNEGDQSFPLTLEIASPINLVSTVDLQDPIWDQSMLESTRLNGNIYGVNTIGTPHTGSNLVFFNKRLFESNGFKTPTEYYAEGKWTWDNMLKCLKDVKALSTNNDHYHGAQLELDILSGSVGASYTKYNYETDTFSSGINDPKLLAAFQWYANAKEQGLLDGSISSFVQGRCGIIVRGTWGLKSTGYFTDMDPNDVGFTYMPSFEEGETSLVSSIYRVYGICEGAHHPDAAGYFIRYLLDPANYDLQNAFLTPEAGQFYYELTNRKASEKYFNFDAGLAALLGQNQNTAFYGAAMNSSSAGIKSAIDSVSNKVDTAVDLANQLVQSKIEADRLKYGN